MFGRLPNRFSSTNTHVRTGSKRRFIRGSSLCDLFAHTLFGNSFLSGLPGNGRRWRLSILSPAGDGRSSRRIRKHCSWRYCSRCAIVLMVDFGIECRSGREGFSCLPAHAANSYRTGQLNSDARCLYGYVIRKFARKEDKLCITPRMCLVQHCSLWQ